ncbi:hypothetical protein LJY25_14330 [Hymenobacter sp. BT175]|uniref:hypothetical protein n=1 Tax=Hymenobacter translucens TaxID=2886507 RepID=UPI001D0E7932|nr:hypothetical protein [Hymenobacter translucens]MCC2547629.1 hypothetical protein [Hymenobacter translucens]
MSKIYASSVTILTAALLLFGNRPAAAQFATTAPAQDGAIGSGEYGASSGNWSMAWDNTNLYIAKTGGGAGDPVYIYLDTDPIIPVNGGSGSNGSLTGTTDYNTTPSLPLRADVRIFWNAQNNYIEYRSRNSSGGWGTAVTASADVLQSSNGTTREMRLRWAALPGLTGRPASFNWLGYEGNTNSPYFVYDQTPTQNYGGNGSSTPYFEYYHTVTSTASTGTTNPFGRTSYTYPLNGGSTLFGGTIANLYDFTMNTPGVTITRDAGAWQLLGSLNLTAGTIAGTTGTPITVAGDLNIRAGATLTLSSAFGGDLNLGGNMTNSGTFNANNRAVTLNGTQSDGAQVLSGPLAFDYLTVNSIGSKTVANNITVAQELRITSGLLAPVPGSRVTLTGTATLSETAISYVKGTLEMSRTLNSSTPTATYPDGLVMQAVGDVYPGTVTVRRLLGTVRTGENEAISTERQYQLTASNDVAGLNVNVSFPYREGGELVNIPESKLATYRSASLNGPWQPITSSVNTADNLITTNLSAFSASYFAFGNVDSPLPVSLTRFEAKAEKSGVLLTWVTASEKNNAGFTVERSRDGREYVALRFVSGAGTSSTARTYRHLDAEAPAAATLYYRLRQTDHDGTIAYSPARVVTTGGSALELSPVPAPAELTVRGILAADASVVLVRDVQGRVVRRSSVTAGQATVSVAGLAPGLYVVEAGAQRTRFVKE